VVDQLDPDGFFYFYLIASGGFALLAGYATGLRLNVFALLVICIVSVFVVFPVSLGFGSTPFAALVSALTAMVSLQVGYFAAVLTRAAASQNAPSAKHAIDVEAQGTVNPGKRGSR